METGSIPKEEPRFPAVRQVPAHLSLHLSLFTCLSDARLSPPACGRPSRPLPTQAKRIVGGHNAQPGFFPWQVLLSVEDLSRVPEDRWFGSGALLSESWVLTAAHVLRSLRRDTSVVPVAADHVKVLYCHTALLWKNSLFLLHGS